MRFKMLSLSVLMMLFLASCSEQHLQEDRLASSKVGEQKGAVKAPQDSVLSLLHQARWGDGSAYLKLADCYRDGFGVKKDFFGMITMANMAVRTDATKLNMIADRIPLAYSMLGDLYYEPDENGQTDKKYAVECYMKAEEHAVLGPHGAERVLDYYKNGGNAQLTEDDIKRLELIVQPKGVETE